MNVAQGLGYPTRRFPVPRRNENKAQYSSLRAQLELAEPAPLRSRL